MSANPSTQTALVASGQNVVCDDFDWPPSAADVNAIEVIDLGPSSSRTMQELGPPRSRHAPAPFERVKRPDGLFVLRAIEQPAPPRAPRRVPMAMPLLALATVEIVVLSNAPTYLDQTVTDAVEAAALTDLTPPTAIRDVPATATAEPLARQTTTRQTPARRSPARRRGSSSLHTGDTYRREPRVRLAVRPAAERIEKRVLDLPRPEESEPVRITERVDLRPTAYAPPRSIEQRKPERVPAPFPTPRGTRTTLELVIDERGRVAASRVTSSGADHYSEPLLAAARTWRFRPALAEGRPTRAVQTVHVAIP